jgi:hypothetical protein
MLSRCLCLLYRGQIAAGQRKKETSCEEEKSVAASVISIHMRWPLWDDEKTKTLPTRGSAPSRPSVLASKVDGKQRRGTEKLYRDKRLAK